MATSNTVEIVVKALDQASSTITSVLGKITGLRLGIGALATSAGTGLALGSLFKEFVQQSSEAEQAVSRFNLAFANVGKNTGVAKQEMVDFAASIQRTTKYTDEAVLEAEAVLFRFGSLTGETFKRARADIIDVAAAMGTDLSTAAQTVGRALENPAQGMRMLRSLGVVLSASQKQLIKDLMDSGQQAKAQGIILTELEKRYKGAAEAAGNTFSGAVAKAKNAFGELFEEPGKLKPMTDAMNELAATLQNPALKQSIQTLVGAMAKLAGYAIEFAAAVTHMFSSGATEADAFEGRIRAIQAQLSAGGKGGAVVGQARKDLEDELALLLKKQQILLGIGEAGAQADAAARARKSGQDGPRYRGNAPIAVKPDLGPDQDALDKAAAAWAKRLKEMEDNTRTSLEKVRAEFDSKQKDIAELLSKKLITPSTAQARGDEAMLGFIDGMSATLKSMSLQDLMKEQLGGDTLQAEMDRITEMLSKGLITEEQAGALGERAGKSYGEALRAAIEAQLGITADSIEKSLDITAMIDKSLGDTVAQAKKTTDAAVSDSALKLGEARAGVDAFVDALTKGLQNAATQGKLSFKSLVSFIISQLLSTALQNAIKELGDSLKSAFSSSGSSGDSGFFGAIMSGIGSLFGGKAGGGFAAGGMLAAAGGMTMVGEEGPELVALPKGSRVYSNSQSKQMSGPSVNFAPTTNVLITASDKDAQTLRAEFAAAIQRNNAQQNKQWAEMLNRNGFGRMR